ncbi:MAG: hypothetical protein IJK68_03155 [Muribaculaceae bacterium]|nr:hypothetical protein [Muribaculaceae bacterium]MBR0023901.1 hypothetical protein [Muribaculaceae bacterium]
MSKNSKIKKSVVFPIIMLAYLAAMAWIGRDRLDRGEYLYYFGIIGVGLLIIVLLYFSLRKKEQLQQRREEEQYGNYDDTNNTDQEQEKDFKE